MIGTAAARGRSHAFCHNAVEVPLRPLLVELGATVPTPGLAVLEPDLDALDELLRPWAARGAGDLTEVAVA